MKKYLYFAQLLYLLSWTFFFPSWSAAQNNSEKKPMNTSLKDVMGAGSSTPDMPLYIKSDSLALDSKGRVFTYTGNVQVVRDDLTITADSVEGRYDEQSRLQTIIARSNVVITKGESMKATANRAHYKVGSAVIELTENPELYRAGNALAADKVTMYINEDRSEAEGNVRMKVVKTDEAEARKQ